MGIVTKNLPYEILLRFSDGSEGRKAKPGDYEGAHYIERPRLVDEDTGEIVGIPKGAEGGDIAVVLPRDKIVEYLGARFADFEATFRARVSQLEAAEKEVAATKEALAEARDELDDARAEISAMSEHFATFRQGFDTFDRDGKKRAKAAEAKAARKAAKSSPQP